MSSPPRSSAPHLSLLVPLLIAVAVIAVVIAWQYLRDDLTESPTYRLDPTRIVVQPEPPPWVPADFLEEALRNAGLDHESSILERRMPERLAAALTAHAWIAEVREVRLVYPGGAEVLLVYRNPVAMVELHDGLLPVDRYGVQLRTDYFQSIAPQKTAAYPRIRGNIPPPLGTVGSAWGDPTVATAARIAWLLRDLPEESGFQGIAVVNTNEEQVSFRLVTHRGSEILWGMDRRPKEAPMFPKEPTAEEADKVKRLCQYVELYGNLDSIPTEQLTNLLLKSPN